VRKAKVKSGLVRTGNVEGPVVTDALKVVFFWCTAEEKGKEKRMEEE
jgi:hypothetical protein